METTTTAVGMTAAQVESITTALTNFGSTLLDYFIQLLPAIATMAAILFVINIIRNKVRS